MEINPMLAWYLFFTVFLSAFLFIIYRGREIRFLFYAMVGALLGYLVFDVPSVALGYYVYVERYYLLSVLGVPVSMALAEGFCVAIAVYVYEKLPCFFGFFKKKWMGPEGVSKALR